MPEYVGVYTKTYPGTISIFWKLLDCQTAKFNFWKRRYHVAVYTKTYPRTISIFWKHIRLPDTKVYLLKKEISPN